MNDYDKAGRYLVKRDPAGFFAWLLDDSRPTFRAWIDSRRVALPKQQDLTNDLVAAVECGGALEAICVELEAEARADALPRLLGYLARLWTEPGSRESLPIVSVGGVILDMTGRSAARSMNLCPAAASACRLEFSVLRRHFAHEPAAALLADVANGTNSPWLLGWIPLMHGGAEPAIIAKWLTTAEQRLADERDRADLGSLANVLAILAGRGAPWERALRGWKMRTVPFLDEIRAEGRQEGLAEGACALVLRQGRDKFGKPPTKKQQQALEAITDFARMEVLGQRLLHVNSWTELLDGE